MRKAIKEQLRYTITMTEAQLRTVNTALEEFFRVRMGQMGDLADSLAGLDVDFSRDNPMHSQIFDAYIQRRDATRIALDAAKNIAFGQHNYPSPGEDARICEDVWQVIRHQLWLDNPDRLEYTVDSREPLLVSQQPIATIRKASDNE